VESETEETGEEGGESRDTDDVHSHQMITIGQRWR